MVEPDRLDFIFDLVLWKIIWGQSGTHHVQFSDVAYATSLKAILPVSLGHIRALMIEYIRALTTHHAILPYQQTKRQPNTQRCFLFALRFVVMTKTLEPA